MMAGEPLALRIEENGYTVLFAGDDSVHIEPNDRARWDELRTALHGRRQIALHVPASSCLDLALPALPASGRAARVMLADASPIPLAELAWTHPTRTEVGRTKITLVRRSWLDPRVGAVENAIGIVPYVIVIVEPDGVALAYRSPAQRRRRTVTTAIMSLSAVIAATSLATLPDRQASAASASTAALDPLPAGEAVAATVAALAVAAPAGAAVARIGADGTGGVSMEVVAADPDTLHTPFSPAATLVGLRKTAQVPHPAGGYRVTYEAQLPAGRGAAGTAPPMTAASRGAASAAARQHWAEEASRRGVRLRLSVETGAGTAPLHFVYAAAGPQGRVLGLADAIESGLPPMQLRDWQLRPKDAGVELTGTLTVPWRRTP